MGIRDKTSRDVSSFFRVRRGPNNSVIVVGITESEGIKLIRLVKDQGPVPEYADIRDRIYKNLYSLRVEIRNRMRDISARIQDSGGDVTEHVTLSPFYAIGVVNGVPDLHSVDHVTARLNGGGTLLVETPTTRTIVEAGDWDWKSR